MAQGAWYVNEHSHCLFDKKMYIPPYGLLIKRYWYQVSVSVTTKPQGVFSQNKQNLWALNHKILVSSERVCNHQTPGCFFLRISRTYGLSIKRSWYQVSMCVTTKPKGAFYQNKQNLWALN